MNRIILIGNGFDLAHDLETGYKHFIDWFWNGIIEDFRKRNTTSFDNEYISIGHSNYTFEKGYLADYKSFKKYLSSYNLHIKFKKHFFETISEKSLINWVDIEEEYYSALNECLEDKRIVLTKKDPIDALNQDFLEVKELLKNYLLEVDKKSTDSGKIRTNSLIQDSIYSRFNADDFTGVGIEALEQKNLEYPNNILYLNFNYTDTDRLYPRDKKEISDLRIYIHGDLKDDKNPIIFGYGDEIDDQYKQIEKRNDNRYLENIKSIKYLETDNYRRLLNFVNSDSYQIFIMGHSCGVSDRTLLSRLFEHKNCVSIKVFYHKKDDGTDNHSDIVRNISRNFEDKVIMREKVVNKQHSKPLGDLC